MKPSLAPEQVPAQLIASSKETVDEEVKLQEPESAQEQQVIHEAALEDLPDGLDPLGIGDVKDHVPAAKRAAVERRKGQLETLMQ